MPEDSLDDVFPSYSSNDKAVVRPLAERVRSCRAEVGGRRRKDRLELEF